MTDKPRVVPSGSPKLLSRAAVLGAVALVTLAACGPTQQPLPAPAETPSSSEAVPFDVKEVVERARAPLPAAHATSASTVISSELSTRIGYVPPSVGQIMPAIAAGNGLYLVVWTEVWSHSSPATVDVYGVRVNGSTGALLDSQPILIGGGSGDQVYPAAGFDGTNFLVVWNSPPLVYGARVRASDGMVLDTPRLISYPGSGQYGPAMPHMNPAVTFDGTNYLVVWNGAYYQGPSTYASGILGAWVRPSDGQPLSTSSFVVSTSQGSNPQVAFGGGRYLVVWSDARNSPSDNVYGVRIDAASRQVLDPTFLPIAVTRAYAEMSPSVASDGTHFLVVWRLTNGTLEQGRVRASDGAILYPFSTVGTGSAKPAGVTFDGRDYRVAWVGNRDGGLKAFSTRLSASGAVEEELLLSSIDSTTETQVPGLAATGEGHFLVHYSQYSSQPRTRMRLVQDVQPSDCGSLGPTLVLNDQAVMTLECHVGGTYSDPGAQAFDGCSNAIPVHAYNTGSDSSGPGPNLGAEGSYTVSYSAWDAMGRTVNATRTVNVEDRMAPTLALKGASFMTHTCNSPWVDPGVEAVDACYGDLAHTVLRAGEVNGWAEGPYTVTYSLTDTGGNSATPVTRTVEVVDCPW